MAVLRSQRGNRRWALQCLAAGLGMALFPTAAFAKRRRAKKKKAAAAPAAAEPAAAAGDALNEAQLSKREDSWHLKNRNQEQRIVVVLRHKGAEGHPTIHAFSLEPGQELDLGVKQPEGVKKPVLTIVTAQYAAS